MDERPGDDLALAEWLHAEWLAGKAKCRIEREAWGDDSSHGRRFDRFIHAHLGVPTIRRSRRALI